MDEMNFYKYVDIKLRELGIQFQVKQDIWSCEKAVLVEDCKGEKAYTTLDGDMSYNETSANMLIERILDIFRETAPEYYWLSENQQAFADAAYDYNLIV